MKITNKFDILPIDKSRGFYYQLLEKDDFVKYNDDIELIFVELPKFNKELDELENIKEQWIYFLKNAGSLVYTI